MIINKPVDMLGGKFLLRMKDGGAFHFVAKEAAGDTAIRGYDEEGNWLQIELDDIEEVRRN